MKRLMISLWVLFPLAIFGQSSSNTISRTISVTRDGQGRIETLTHPNGKVQEYTYNALTGHETVTYDGSEIVSGTIYGVNGLPKKITYRAYGAMPSAVVDYTYDGQNRLLSHKVSMSGTRYYMHNTTFNDWGFLKTYKRDDAGMNNKTITYAYGSRGELTGFNIGGVGTASYDYDNNGNLTERTGFSSGDFQLPTMSAEYDSQTNRRLGWVYDPDGNLTQDDRFIYEYNLLGRLEKIRKISNGRIIAHYLYDSDGMRVRAVVEDKVTYTIRDDLGRVISQEIDRSRMDGGLDVTIKNFVYHNNSNILTVTYHPDGSVTRRYHFRNYLSHPVLVVDEENGFAYEYREYAPYGHQMTAEPQETPTQQFTGHERDAYADADYMRARYYHWEFGRFNRPDPAFNFDPENPYSYNLYGYTHNNPVNAYDPDGKVVWMLVGAAIGAGADLTVQLLQNGGDLSEVNYWQVLAGAGMGALGGGGVSQAVKAGGKSALRVIGETFAKETVEGLVPVPLPTKPPKKIPNPFGRKGGLAHQAEIKRLEKEIKSRNLAPDMEHHIKTPNGKKNRRFVDVAAIDPATEKPVEFYQVGKQNKNGTPIKRERDAIIDIENETGKPVTFVPYNKEKN